MSINDYITIEGNQEFSKQISAADDVYFKGMDELTGQVIACGKMHFDNSNSWNRIDS